MSESRSDGQAGGLSHLEWNPTTQQPWDSRVVDASGLPALCRRQSVFLLRRRMNITTPNNTAITPQITRNVVVSIDKLSFPLLIGRLHVFNHGHQIAHQVRHHRTDGHHEQRGQHTEEDREYQLHG